MLLPLCVVAFHIREGVHLAEAMGDEVDYDDLLADAEQEEDMYGDFMDDIEAEMAMEAEVNKPQVFESHGLWRELYIFIELYWTLHVNIIQ